MSPPSPPQSVVFWSPNILRLQGFLVRLSVSNGLMEEAQGASRRGTWTLAVACRWTQPRRREGCGCVLCRCRIADPPGVQRGTLGSFPEQRRLWQRKESGPDCVGDPHEPQPYRFSGDTALPPVCLFLPRTFQPSWVVSISGGLGHPAPGLPPGEALPFSPLHGPWALPLSWPLEGDPPVPTALSFPVPPCLPALWLSPAQCSRHDCA